MSAGSLIGSKRLRRAALARWSLQPLLNNSPEPRVDRAAAPVSNDESTGEGEQVDETSGVNGEAGLQESEVGEEEGWAGVEQLEQEAGWSPAPPRLCSSNKEEDPRGQTAATLRAVYLMIVSFTRRTRAVRR